MSDELWDETKQTKYKGTNSSFECAMVPWSFSRRGTFDEVFINGGNTYARITKEHKYESYALLGYYTPITAHGICQFLMENRDDFRTMMCGAKQTFRKISWCKCICWWISQFSWKIVLIWEPWAMKSVERNFKLSNSYILGPEVSSFRSFSQRNYWCTPVYVYSHPWTSHTHVVGNPNSTDVNYSPLSGIQMIVFAVSQFLAENSDHHENTSRGRSEKEEFHLNLSCENDTLRYAIYLSRCQRVNNHQRSPVRVNHSKRSRVHLNFE